MISRAPRTAGSGAIHLAAALLCAACGARTGFADDVLRDNAPGAAVDASEGADAIADAALDASDGAEAEADAPVDAGTGDADPCSSALHQCLPVSCPCVSSQQCCSNACAEGVCGIVDVAPFKCGSVSCANANAQYCLTDYRSGACEQAGATCLFNSDCCSDFCEPSGGSVGVCQSGGGAGPDYTCEPLPPDCPWPPTCGCVLARQPCEPAALGITCSEAGGVVTVTCLTE